MSDHKALFKHSVNYGLASLATKALAFISIPVYTRLLTVSDYGIMGVFLSLVGVATVLFTLNSEVAISRYFYDSKDENDFKEFVGTSIILTFVILCITILVFIMILPVLSESFSFSKKLTFCLLPVSLYSIINSIFSQIYNPLMQSKKIAIVSSVQAYLAFGLSVVCIFFLQKDKYYGVIYGNILAMLLLCTYLYRQIRPYFIASFKNSHIKYILSYCLPYMPYTLSGVILHQFSRIFMGNDQGYDLTGAYTLTTNIALLMMTVIGITHSAWNPYYFRYMNVNDYKSIDSDYSLIWKATLLIAFGLSAFGYEMALLLSKGGEYLSTMYVLPILVLGYVFYQWAYVYLRNTGYAKRNIWNAYCVLTSGGLNIVLNAFLVPKYAEIGAAIATALSFFILLILSYLSNRFVIKKYVPKLGLFIRSFMIYLVFIFFVFLLSYLDICLTEVFVIKVFIFLCLGICFVYPYRSQFLRLIHA